jgi:soluble lytic murein transglycosylase-like protein
MNAKDWRLLIEVLFAFWVAIVILLALFQDAPANEAIPREAYKYRSAIIREARFSFGLSAPTATFASQIHAESGFRANICNPIAACGLSQFMPATARAMARLHKDLSPAQPTNPAWAIRALVRLDYYLWEKTRGNDTCARMHMVLIGYNAGEGRMRKKWRPKETQRYLTRIFVQLEPLYVQAGGWGLGSCS